MCILLAVMLTDVVLLDVFNTMGNADVHHRIHGL